MVSHVEGLCGGVDILLNCAMGFPQSYKGAVWNTADRDWGAFMDISVRAKYLAAHFVSRGMMRRGCGLIANISAGESRDEYYNPFIAPFGTLPHTLPIFPLPAAILMPNSELPLNIFEPRYLNMINDGLPVISCYSGVEFIRYMASSNGGILLM